METVIILPLYLIVLAGIFWLGEMCLIRQGLCTAEQLRLWESGTRHSLSQIGQSQIFWEFPIGTGTRSTLTTGVDGLTANHTEGDNPPRILPGFKDTPTTTLGWGTEKNGFVQLNTRRSEWSWGIADFARRSLWTDSLGAVSEEEEIRAGRDVMTMQSRASGNGNPQLMNLYFRREVDDGNRAGSTPYSGDPPLWNSIYLEKWDTFGSFGPPVKLFGSISAAELTEYGDRKQQFDEWSLSLDGK